MVGELRDGMTIGFGGWGSRRKPMAVVRAILRAGVGDLTVVSYGGPDVGVLCAAGRVRKAVYAFVTLDSIALDPHFRKARQAGTIEAMEIDEGMFYLGLLAASQRVPFLPTRAGLGSDVMRVNPGLRTVRSPYDDGEELVAMPALALDAAFVHVNRADTHGNAQMLGPDPFFDELFLGAADPTLRHRREGGGAGPAHRRGPHPDRHRQPADDRRRGRGRPAAPTSRRVHPTTTATSRSRRRMRRRPPTPTRGRRSTAATSRSTRPGTAPRVQDRPSDAAVSDRGHPGRGLCRGVRRGVARRRRGDGEPLRHRAPDRCPPGPAHVRARPRAHRRRGRPHGQHARRCRPDATSSCSRRGCRTGGCSTWCGRDAATS